MKRVIVLCLMGCLSACANHLNDPSIQYRQVLATPSYQIAESYDDAPVDVTETIVNFY